MSKKTFYVTTPIYYVNDVASIGHAYTNIMADVCARWHRLNGEKVFFLTGTDENSQKTVKAAKEKYGEDIGRKEIKKYADDMAQKWKKGWKELNMSNDDFIRTTEERHIEIVYKFFNKVHKKGDIYKGEYKGLYCDGCEAFLTEKDLVEENCPYHNKPPREIAEENYFFKLSKYQKKILKYIEEHPDFIQPISRRNEVISFIKEEGIRDISISRPLKEWGIPLPIDKNHFFWVWFDALVNYISGAPKYWPASLHLLAKDILRFHCIIWPGMLMSAGYPLPEKLFVHGFLTINGQKMSKSLGNAINPLHLSKKYGVDPVRYFLVRAIPFGQDGDFSEDALVTRLNNELANELGNLVSRTLSLAEKNFKKIKKNKIELKFNLKKIEDLMENYELDKALAEIFRVIQSCNQYINKNKVWEMESKEKEVKLYNLLENLRVISILLSPFMPETCEKINKQLNVKNGKLKDCELGKIKEYKVKRGGVLFKKIEVVEPPKKYVKLEEKITFEDFDFRVGEITGVKDHPNADKLYILKVDLGRLHHDDLQIVSGLKEWYKKGDLIGKKIIVLRNLKEAVIRRIESQGMLLAACEGKELALLTCKKSENGDRVFIDLREKAKEEVSIEDFLKLELTTLDGKIIYKNKPLRTEKEKIGLDKKMKDGVKIE